MSTAGIGWPGKDGTANYCVFFVLLDSIYKLFPVVLTLVVLCLIHAQWVMHYYLLTSNLLECWVYGRKGWEKNGPLLGRWYDPPRRAICLSSGPSSL
jgi:hypothetical protein